MGLIKTCIKKLSDKLVTPTYNLVMAGVDLFKTTLIVGSGYLVKKQHEEFDKYPLTLTPLAIMTGVALATETVEEIIARGCCPPGTGSSFSYICSRLGNTLLPVTPLLVTMIVIAASEIELPLLVLMGLGVTDPIISSLYRVYDNKKLPPEFQRLTQRNYPPSSYTTRLFDSASASPMIPSTPTSGGSVLPSPITAQHYLNSPVGETNGCTAAFTTPNPSRPRVFNFGSSSSS